MKKLLLTLLLLLSLGFAATAEQVTETLTYTDFSNSSTVAYATARTYTSLESGLSYKIGAYINSGKFQQNNGKGCFFEVTGNSNNVNIVKIELEGCNGQVSYFVGKANDSYLSTNVTAGNGTGSISGGTVVDYNNGVFAVNNQYFSYYVTSKAKSFTFSSVKVTYETPAAAEKITLDAANLSIKDGEGNALEAGASYEYAAGSKFSFSYATEENAEITYSYSVNDGEAVEGNEYTYDGTAEVKLTVNATSENTVSKTITITKQYPTECPKPVFSVANYAEVYAGQVITVTAEGAEKLELIAGDDYLEGTENISYTVAGNIGDTIELLASASVTGKNGQITEGNNITVTIVEKPFEPIVVEQWELVTDASTLAAGDHLIIARTAAKMAMSSASQNNYREQLAVTIENSILSYTTEPLIVELEGTEGEWKFHTLNYQGTNGYFMCDTGSNNYLKIGNEGQTATIEIGTNSDATIAFNITNSTPHNLLQYNASNKRFACYASSSKQAPVQIYKLVKKELYPELVEDATLVTITHGKVAGVVTVDYTFEIANYNGGNLEVTATIDGYDVEFTKVETPATAPARAAGDASENAVFSGKLKAQHDEFKGIAPFSGVNVKATLGGQELYNVNHTERTTTGIEDVTVDGNAAAEYFNLQGVRVAEPQAGQVYIVRRGATVTKELVK